MIWIVYVVMGAIGGLIPVWVWSEEEKYRYYKVSVNVPLVIRNSCIGAIVGGYFGTIAGCVFVAILTGLAGEFIIQKFGKLIKGWHNDK